MNGLKKRLYPKLPVGAQNLMLSVGGWRRARQRYGAGFQRYETLLAESEQWTESKLRAYQETRLREIVAYACKHVPYYRDLMRRYSLTPEMCSTLDGLRRLPILTKADVQDHATRLRSNVDTGPVRVVHTGGTTGTSLKITVEQTALDYHWAVIWRQRRRMGLAPGDRYASFSGDTILPSHQTTPPYWRYDRGEGRILFSNWHLSEATLPVYLDAYNAYAPKYVQGYPSFLFAVAEYAQRTGTALHHPVAVFTSSETLRGEQRAAIAQTFGAPVLDFYSSGEQVAAVSECEAGGYHVDAEFGILEIVDGQAVATTLHNRAMPLLRYALGDGLAWRKERCRCGRSLPLVHPPMGRLDDVIVTPSGRRFGRLDHLFKDTPAIREAQLVQTTPEHLTVRVVLRPGAICPTTELHHQIRARLGDELQIQVEIMDAIPRSTSGKFRFVVSELKQP